MRRSVIHLVAGLLLATAQPRTQGPTLVAPGATVERLATGFGFLEGPAADLEGNLYFSDIQSERIYRWTPDDGVTTFREATGRAHGIRFTLAGQLLICEMGNRRVTAIDTGGNTFILADELERRRFNSPDDLLGRSEGRCLFQRPTIWADDDKKMDGDHVYYISSDRTVIRRVADDLVRPNGIVGTMDGSRVYIADHGAGRTYVYRPANDGSLGDKRLFATQGADGMTVDEMGNVYLTGQDITIYDPNGAQVASIAVPEAPANLAFGGADGTTLFITARTSLYALAMTVTGQ